MAKLERILIVPDTHVPFEDVRAWNLMMDVARDLKPETVLHQGDLADCYSISSHSKDPKRVSRLKEEMVRVRGRRAELDSLEPKRKVITEGNHEWRLARYLRDKAPELDGLLSVDELMGLTDNDWQLVPYRDHVKIGKVYFTHDTGSGGKYATARAMEAYQHSVSIGHHHAMQFFVYGDATGKHQVGAQFGWLGDPKQVDYLHKIKANRLWTPGFGIGYHDLASHYVYLQPVPLVGYTACVEGKVYRG